MTTTQPDDVLGADSGPVADLRALLAGPQGPQWALALKRFVGKENPYPLSPDVRTIPTGGLNRDDLLNRLEAEGIEVTELARDLMTRPGFRTAPRPLDVPFACLAVSGLFAEGPTTGEAFGYEPIFDVAGRGLALCEPDDAAHLLLADAGLAPGEPVYVAMAPLTGASGHPRVFVVDVSDQGRRRLDAYSASADDYGSRWRLADRFVFRRAS
ncbi:hypothetical protein AB0M32_42470 [Streptomyces sp. NPDC051985]|uniref:hypothetical protein n=1 Tax=Streptomyces sp. NPDC051985 TaxID=3155807 RepID=UPI00343D24FF